MHASEHSRLSRMSGPVGLGIAACAGVLLLACIGLPPGTKPWLGALSATVVTLSAAPFALVYLLAAWGLGRPLAVLLARASPHRHWLQLALGLGAMLWLSHLLGLFGLLSSGVGGEHNLRARAVGWTVVALGCSSLLHQIARGTLRPETWPIYPRSLLLLAPALAVLIIAACNPPGRLWRSEFGAYDALEYHLQLPKEWAAGARLWPADHNVYSYLPSYVEAAYLHLGTLMPGPADAPARMLGGEALWILACQFLHAGLLIAAAALSGRAAVAACTRAGTHPARAAFLGVLAAGIVLGLPWSVVVGSLAYNEAGVLAMLAGGTLAALDPATRPWARGIICGLCAGIATSCKPTAAFLVAPVIGLLLLAHLPARQWWMAILFGAIAGIAAVAPWLIRNAIASGNALFPFAAEVLGQGHWTLEQVARYRHAHFFFGTPVERLERLISVRYGLKHDQWALTLGLLPAVIIAPMLWRPARFTGGVLVIGLALQAIAWAALTHLQSRFLLPVVVPFAVLTALAGAALLSRFSSGAIASTGRFLASLALAIVTLTFAGWSIALFLTDDAEGRPNQLLIAGPGGLTGFGLEDRLRSIPENEQDKFLLDNATPAGSINTILRPQNSADSGVYLLGDSAPLYILAACGLAACGQPASSLSASRSPVLYHTTWDASPLGRAVADAPGSPPFWSDAMRALGIRYILIDFDELTRLSITDGNYDPAVTPAVVAHWINDPEAGLVMVRVWPNPHAPANATSGTILYRLRASLPRLHQSHSK